MKKTTMEMTNAQTTVLWTLGALHIPQFLSKESAHLLRTEVERIMANRELMCEPSAEFSREYKADSSTYVNQHDKSLHLMRLVVLLKSMANQALHKRAVFHMSLIQCNEAGKEQGISWHQDVDPVFARGATYNFLIYPEDCFEDSGALLFVPGSHLHGRLMPGEPFGFLEGQMMIIPKAGDLVVLNGSAFHCVPRNKTDNRRFSVNLRFRDRLFNPDDLTVGLYRTGRCDYSGRVNYEKENRRFLSEANGPHQFPDLHI